MEEVPCRKRIVRNFKQQANKENDQMVASTVNNISTSKVATMTTSTKNAVSQAPPSAIKRARSKGNPDSSTTQNLGVTYALGAHDMTLPSPARVESLRKFAKAKGLATPSPGRASAAITMLQLTTGASKQPPGSGASNQSPLLLGPSTIGDICQTMTTYLGDRNSEIDIRKFAMDIGTEVDRVEDLRSILQLLGIMNGNTWMGLPNLPATLETQNWDKWSESLTSKTYLHEFSIAKLANLLLHCLVETFGMEPEATDGESCESYSWTLESLVPLLNIALSRKGVSEGKVNDNINPSKPSEAENLMVLQRLHDIVSVLVAVGLARITKAALTLGQYRYAWTGIEGVHRSLGWSPQQVAKSKSQRTQRTGMPPPASKTLCSVTPIETTHKPQVTPKSVMEGRRNSRAEIRDVVRKALHTRKLDGSGTLDLGASASQNSSNGSEKESSGIVDGQPESNSNRSSQGSTEHSKSFAKFSLAHLHEAAQQSDKKVTSTEGESLTNYNAIGRSPIPPVLLKCLGPGKTTLTGTTLEITGNQQSVPQRSTSDTLTRKSTGPQYPDARPTTASAYFNHPLQAPLAHLGEASNSMEVTESVLEASQLMEKESNKAQFDRENERSSSSPQSRTGKTALPALSCTGKVFESMPLPSEMLAYQTRCLKEFMKHYLIHYKRYDNKWVLHELEALEKRCEEYQALSAPISTESPLPRSDSLGKEDSHLLFSQNSAGSLSSNAPLERTSSSNELLAGPITGMLFSPLPFPRSDFSERSAELVRSLPQSSMSQAKLIGKATNGTEEFQAEKLSSQESSDSGSKKRTREFSDGSDSDDDELPTTVAKKRLSNPQSGPPSESPFTSFSNFLPDTR